MIIRIVRQFYLSAEIGSLTEGDELDKASCSTERHATEKRLAVCCFIYPTQWFRMTQGLSSYLNLIKSVTAIV